MKRQFVYAILCVGSLSLSEGRCGDDFETHEKESQSNAVQQINNDVRDCTQDMKQGWVEGMAKGGEPGAIYGGVKAGIDCAMQQSESVVNQNSKN